MHTCIKFQFFFFFFICTYLVFRDSLDSPPEEGSQKSSLILSLPRFPILSRPSLPKGWAEKSYSFWNLAVSAFVLFSCLLTSVVLQDAEYRHSVGWGKRNLRFLNLTSCRQSNKLWKIVAVSLNVRANKWSCNRVTLSSSCNMSNITFCKISDAWSCRTGNLEYEILYGAQIWNKSPVTPLLFLPCCSASGTSPFYAALKGGKEITEVFWFWFCYSSHTVCDGGLCTELFPFETVGGDYVMQGLAPRNVEWF